MAANQARIYTLEGRILSKGSATPSNAGERPQNMSNRIEASRDGRWLVTSRCGEVQSSKGGACSTKLFTAAGELLRELGELTAAFPSFSPDGSWLAAGNRLVHIESGRSASLDDQVRVSIFAPNGDLYAGNDDFSLTRYCRRAVSRGSATSSRALWPGAATTLAHGSCFEATPEPC